MASSAQTLKYAGVVAVCLAGGMVAGWFAEGIDHQIYDALTRRTRPLEQAPQAVVVAIDEATLAARGGQRNYRSILAEALDAMAPARPKAVAIDMILADPGDPAEDARLEASMRATPNLILASPLVNGKWEDPLPRFQALARAVGQVNLEPDRLDGVGRQIPLEEVAGKDRRWALALEAYRIANGVEIIESPEDLQIGATIVPAARADSRRPLLIRYLPPEGILTVSVLEVRHHLETLRGKVVFLGVTALGARDRLLNSYRQNVPGVEVHAHAFETLARGRFLAHASNSTAFGLSLAFAALAGLIFAFLEGWAAYAAAGVVLVVATLGLPLEFFGRGVVLPFAPVAVAWLSVAGAATYQHVFVRRQLRRTESEKSRYQQAIHWAAHEMRTPLTAIQGSSEIMTRYHLPEEKRNQLNEMINSESKRLSRIITMFLDVERLAEGQMELKHESFEAADVVETCLGRVRPIAGQKRISVSLEGAVAGTLVGDRELMEYALYNLLTNAVKYSPAGTEVHVVGEFGGGELRLGVRDQGMGMDSKELKKILTKFYRTQSAEASGEVGTGIGLSIVDQIVAHHGGRIDVTSTPGKGSCFTMVLRTQPPSP